MRDKRLIRIQADKARDLALAHADTWQGEDELEAWLPGLVKEMGELASSLVNKHEHSPEVELTQIAAIAINWLAERVQQGYGRPG